MKRSKAVHLLYLGIAATALQGCGEDERPRGYVEPPTIQSVATGEGAYFSMQECQSRFDQALCDQSAAEARAEHAENAPKFASQESCEDFSGPGMCEPAPQTAGASSGGSSFMPMMMGFMVGRAIGNMSGAGRGYYAGPPQGCDRYGAAPTTPGANCARPARGGAGVAAGIFSTSRAGRDAPFSGSSAMTAARAPVGAVADSRVMGANPAAVRSPTIARVAAPAASRPGATVGGGTTTRGGFGSTGQSRGWFSGS
ncbi:DUF1190 domain-containing protein [Neomegalonema perideroedes]|uniref:DUF1190 domain-containing protein n=1 Tax=Neomegalonema perideroedes TaxID=217219 RepID=UPI0003758B8F|nr:DUF1190 domain-containing protein [Neomegalonema perideroedes]